jgi:hypothetical protein
MFLFENYPCPAFYDIFAVYYRVYTENGLVEPRNRIPQYIRGDRSLTYIWSIMVAPPHNIASLKSCICKQEQIIDSTGTKLFLSLTSQAPLEDHREASILSPTGLGYQPDDPLALFCAYNDTAASRRVLIRNIDMAPGSKYGVFLSSSMV